MIENANRLNNFMAVGGLYRIRYSTGFHYFLDGHVAAEFQAGSYASPENFSARMKLMSSLCSRRTILIFEGSSIYSPPGSDLVPGERKAYPLLKDQEQESKCT